LADKINLKEERYFLKDVELTSELIGSGHFGAVVKGIKQTNKNVKTNKQQT